jgi:Heat induced stress protein YflT domain
MSKDNAIIAVFESHEKAETAIKDLQKSGFDMKKLSIIGKGFHKEEHPVGFYTTGDRVKFWGGTGALWGGVWGMLFGAAFFWVPGIGPIAIGGPFVHILIGALEGAAVLGGLSALGAGLASIGLPKEKIIRYESELKADKFLLIAHGEAKEVEKAREIMERVNATSMEMLAAA